MSPADLGGQVALVTGASRGIGREIALGLADAGMSVAVFGRDLDRLNETRQSVERRGVLGLASRVDVTDVDDVARGVEQVRTRLGPIRVLVNNAGSIDAHEVPLWESDPDDWWHVVETNVRGPFLVSRAVLPDMISSGGGRVVDVNSGFGTRDGDIYSAYAASKAALFRITGAVAEAGRDHGVYAFAVAPGVVRTDMTLSMPYWDGTPDSRWTPVGRIVSLVRAIAEGRLDSLSGRYLRADKDDVDVLLAHAEEIARVDARSLRIRRWGSDDPIG